MRWKTACSIGILALLLGPCLVHASSSTPLSTVSIESPLHFLSPDENAITVGPGIYAVEETGNQSLQLVPLEGTPVFILQAASIHHDEQLSEPTVLLILTDDDIAHLVLLRPDGTALDSVGSLSGVRSRAPFPITPNVSPTPLTGVQITQGLKAFGEAARIVGVPPTPVLTTPPVGHNVAAWGEQFSWQPGAGSPAPTSYQLCIAEAGKACARPGQVSTTSVVIANLPPTLRTYRITGPMLQPLLAYGQQKNLTWTIGACVPSQTIGPPGGLISSGPGQLTCQYARPRPLTWKYVLKAPFLSPPRWPLINDRPQLSIQGPVEGAHHYLFCLIDPMDLGADTTTICGTSSQEVSIHQTGASVSLTQVFIVNTGTFLSTSGWEWKREANVLPGISVPNQVRVPVVGIPFFSGSKTLYWSVGACLDEHHLCSWSPSVHLTMLPVISSNPHSIQESPSRYRFEWPAVNSAEVTHYRVCLATAGSSFPLVYWPSLYELVYFPGMLRDLCSDRGDIPPEQKPVYVTPLPPEVGSFCPPGGCRMPQPVATYTAGAGLPRYILELKDHPELAQFGGQPLVLAVAACSGSNRNCLWRGDVFRKIELPTDSREPSPVTPSFSPSSFSFNWRAWWGNSYYIPCVREMNATCETGNLLSQPRLDAPRAGTQRDHPQNCSLEGPSLAGVKFLQVAGCNDAWGCRWSPPRQFNFTSTHLPPSQSPLMCRQP